MIDHHEDLDMNIEMSEDHRFLSSLMEVVKKLSTLQISGKQHII